MSTVSAVLSGNCMNVCLYPICTIYSWAPLWTDFVLVWEESLAVQKDELEGDKSSHATRDTHRKWREEFMSRLQVAGIKQEMVSDNTSHIKDVAYMTHQLFPVRLSL